MVDVFTQIQIRRPKDHVAAYAADPDHAPTWYVNIKSCEWVTSKPLAVDSQITFVAHFLGKELKYTYVITTYSPGQKLVMQTAQGPFPMETTYEWIGVDNQLTLMTLRNKGNPVGFSKLISPFMASMIRKANEKDLRKLKQILEQQ